MVLAPGIALHGDDEEDVLNPLYGDLRPGDIFISDNIDEALWMVVGVEEMPERDGWIKMYWTYLEEPGYGVYEEERAAETRVEEEWPLIQRGPT
jgi:hypothetical protein